MDDNILKQLELSRINKLIKIWESTGLLKDIPDDKKSEMSRIFDKEAITNGATFFEQFRKDDTNS